MILVKHGLCGGFIIISQPEPELTTTTSDAPQPTAGALRAQAQRCRRLAQSVTDQRAADTLLAMACEYDAKAEALRGPASR